MIDPLLMPWQFHHYEQLTSTMDQALKILADPRLCDTDRHAITATVQTKGRGRYQRRWISKAGNIHLSLLLKPVRTLYFWPQLSFVTSIAVHDWIQQQLPDNDRQGLTLKWPNDILLYRKKISGILLEIHNDAQGQPWMIIGIGINIVSSPQDLPYPTTFLHAHTQLRDQINVRDLTKRFDDGYEQWCDHGFTIIKEQWLERCMYYEQNIKIEIGGKEYHAGQFIGLDNLGRVLIDSYDAKHAIATGEISFAKEYYN